MLVWQRACGTDHEGVAQHGHDGAFLQVRTGPVLYGLLGVHPLLALQRVVAEGHGGGAAPLADVLRHAAVRPQHARHAAHRSASHPTKPAFCSPLCQPPNKASVLFTALPATQQSQRFVHRSASHPTKPAFCSPLCQPPNKASVLFTALPATQQSQRFVHRSASQPTKPAFCRRLQLGRHMAVLHAIKQNRYLVFSGAKLYF